MKVLIIAALLVVGANAQNLQACLDILPDANDCTTIVVRANFASTYDAAKLHFVIIIDQQPSHSTVSWHAMQDSV